MVLGARPGLLMEAFFRGAQLREQKERRRMDQERIKFQQAQLQQQTAAAQQTAQAKAARQKQLDDLKAEEQRGKLREVFGKQLQAAQDDPRRTQVLLEQGRRLGFAEELGLPGAPQPEAGLAAAAQPEFVGPPTPEQAAIAGQQQFEGDIQDAITRSQATAAVPVPKGPQGQLDIFMRLNPQLELGTPEFRRAFNAWNIQQRKAGATTVDMGLGKGAAAKQQSAVIEAQVGLGALDQIEQSIQAAGGHDVLSSGLERLEAGAVGAVGGIAPGLVGEQTREKQLARSDAEVGLSRFNSQIMNMLSGAAISEPEMKRLEKSLPLVSDPPWVRKAKMAVWRRHMQLVEARGIGALKHGVESGQINPDAWKRGKPGGRGVDKEAAQIQKAASRYQQLIANGIPPKEAAAKVREEF